MHVGFDFSVVGCLVEWWVACVCLIGWLIVFGVAGWFIDSWLVWLVG
jgi:hypothetical protein